MNDKIKTDVLNVLHNLIKLLETKDYYVLAELSNHTIHNASIYQDVDSNQIAVITYAMSKLIEHDKSHDFSDFRSKFVMAMEDLQQQNLISYRSRLKEILKLISEHDTKLQIYINEVIELAKIKKGSKIYDHGVSLARAAEILGISQWELMNYVGKTMIADKSEVLGDVSHRLDVARGLFD